jgi:CheY-like chemotaxis protein
MQELTEAACGRISDDILVVEDEVLVRMLIADILAATGLPTMEARDAEEALAEVSQRQKRPRVLVTDINLGRGMDGVAFAALMQQRWPELPVVYVTANPDRLEGRKLGPHERLVPKPFDIETLTMAVQAVLPA